VSAALRGQPAARGAVPPADARQLAALVKECMASAIARRALLLRLSGLAPDKVRPHHLRLAREALMPLAGADRAQQFQLPNEDVVIVWRGETVALAECRGALRHLFADDPELAPDPDALALQFALPQDGEVMLAAVTASTQDRSQAPIVRTVTTPLDPPTLALLEQALAQADVSRFARRQPVCQLTSSGMRLCWERRHLSDSELFETILPDRAPRADPWLFRRLTRTLDRRMLAFLGAADELRGAGAFSLDLNVTSILAPEFLRFDAALPAALRGQVLLNLRPEDILADPASFLFARDFARARGYRLLLHEVGPAHLALLPLDRLGLDLVQLAWSETIAGATGLPEGARIMLSGADTVAAVAWGRARNVSLYQGQLARPDWR